MCSQGLRLLQTATEWLWHLFEGGIVYSRNYREYCIFSVKSPGIYFFRRLIYQTNIGDGMALMRVRRSFSRVFEVVLVGRCVRVAV